MTITQLRCFYEVSTAGGFSKAAENLFMSQSSISKYIGQLEQEFGLTLFTRQGKSVTLTHEGRALLPYCRSVLTDTQRMHIEASKLRRKISPTDTTIRLYGIPTMSFYGCITLINAFIAAYPQYDVVVNEASESDIQMNLQIGACDIAFCSDLEVNLEKYQTAVVIQESFRAAMARKYWPFDGRSQIMLADLRDMPLVLNRSESMLFDLSRNACLANGFEPNVKFMSNRLNGIMEFLCGQPCCYIGLSRVVMRNETELVCSALIADHPPVQFLFCWNRETAPPAVRKFAAFIQARIPALRASIQSAD